MGIRYSIDEDFFEKWSQEMAYVLGFLYADGSLEDAEYIRGKYIRVTSIDQEIIIKIKRLLNSEHRIVVLVPASSNRNVRYFLRIGNQRIYKRLTFLGLKPKKSLKMKFPKVPQVYLNAFIRGYFDGDGCVMLEKRKKKDRIAIIRIKIAFTSGSRIFLEDLEKRLRGSIPLKESKIYNSHRSFQLCYSSEGSLKLFKFFYRDISDSLFLERKFQIFREYFKNFPEKIDDDIRIILGQNMAVW